MNTTDQNDPKKILSKHPIKNFAIGVVVILIFLIGHSLFAQVGVGNTNPQAQLDISASNITSPTNQDGILIPRVTNLPANASMTVNQDGMLVFYDNTGEDGKGFYYWDDAASDWIKIAAGNLNDNDWTVNGANIERQSGNVYIGDVPSTNNDLYISDQIIDWDNVSYVINPDGDNKINEIELDDGGLTDPSLYFEGDTDFGLMYNPLSNKIFLVENGLQRLGLRKDGGIEPYGGIKIGINAGLNNTSNSNIFIGQSAGSSNTSGTLNYGIGTSSLSSATTNGINVAIGHNTLTDYIGNSVPGNNVSIGHYSMSDMIDGSLNTAVGIGAMENINFNSNSNVAVGTYALRNLASGTENTVLGYSAGNSSDGFHNLYLGFGSGYNADGDRNIFLGYRSGYNAPTGSDMLYIENSNSNTPLVYGEFDNDILRINGELQVGIPTGTGYSFPTADGTLNQVLATDGAGQISFVNTSTLFTDTNTTYDGTDFALSNQSVGAGQYVIGIDASGALISGTDQDDQNIQNLSFNNSTNILTVGIENGTAQNVNLSSLDNSDHDWYTQSTTNEPSSINDNIYTQGKVAIGQTSGNGFLDILANNTGAQPHINLVDDGSTGARINFTNTGTTNGNVWTLYGDSDNTASNSRFNLFHSGTGNIMVVTGDGDVGIGDPTPDATLDVNGSFQYTDGNQLNGYVLTTDANGTASWTNPSTLGVVTAINGLSATGNQVRLGGNLTQNTQIDLGTQTFDINLDSTGDFAIQDNGTDILYVENTGDIGIGNSNPTYPLHITESVNGTTRGLFIDKTDNSASETSGLYVEKTGNGSGRNHAIFTDVDGSGDGQKYGIFNRITSSANGGQYGTRNFLSGATGSFQFGTFNNLDNNGTGNQYGVYNGMRGTGAANLFGVYNEFERAYSGVNIITGVRNRFTNGTPGTNGMNGIYTDFTTSANGTYYGVRNEYTAAATGTGTKYGSYNLINDSAGGTHYGVYSEATNSSGYAGYFLGRFSVGTATNTKLEVNAAGDTYLGGDTYWNDINTGGTTIGRFIDDGNDGLFQIYENGIASITLDANGASVFNEQGLNRDFRVESENNVNMIRVDANTDHVGVGGFPNIDFHVFHGNNGNADGMRLQNTNNNNWIRMYVSSGTGDLRFFSTNQGTTAISNINDVSGVYTATSDRRLKKDFKNLYFSWAEFMNLQPLTYKYKADNEAKNYIGMVAQDVQKIYPELITYHKEQDVYHMDYSATGVIAVKAVQELKKEVDSLKTENAILKEKLSKLEALEARILALENNNSSTITISKNNENNTTED